jgi:hypothetical protein
MRKYLAGVIAILPLAVAAASAYILCAAEFLHSSALPIFLP